MITTPIPTTAKRITIEKIVDTNYDAIKDYYDIAGPDYAYWSKQLNMHFGYCKKIADIFNLEKMLVQMNELVLEQLSIASTKCCSIADLGCALVP